MAVKLLITDAYSNMGRALWAAFEHTRFALLTPRCDELDWENAESITQYLQNHEVALVINNLGWSEKPDMAQQLKLVTGAKTLAAACAATDAIALHLSSYRVFGGENKTIYDEEDTPSPLGPAGRAFLEAERCFEKKKVRHLCLRLGHWLDIQDGSELANLLSALVSEGDVIELGLQHRSAPISAEAVGRIVVAMVHQVLCGAENWGLFHCASGDACMLDEFVEVVADILQQEGICCREWRVSDVPGDMDNVSEPDSSVLSVGRLRDNFGVQQISWRQGLTRLVQLWLDKGVERRKLAQKHSQSSEADKLESAG